MKKKDTMQEERMENIEGFLRGAANALGVELFPAPDGRIPEIYEAAARLE